MGKVVKGIGRQILREVTRPGNLGDIVYGIGKQILGGKKTEESFTTPDLVNEV